MQLSLHFPPDSHHFPFPWKTTHFKFIQNPTSKTLQQPFPKTLNLSNSLKTSFNYESEEVQKGDDPPPVTARLPVVIRKPGSVFRYFWDGNGLRLVRVDGGNLPTSAGFDDKFGNLLSFCRLGVRNFFIPQRVSGNYLDYVKWKFLHRVFSSALQVLATQVIWIVVESVCFEGKKKKNSLENFDLFVIQFIVKASLEVRRLGKVDWYVLIVN